MSNRVFGMAPGGRMSLDRAANRLDDRKWKPMIGNTRRDWDRNGRPREKKGAQE